MIASSPLDSLFALLSSPQLVALICAGVPFGLALGVIPGIGGRFGLIVAIPFVLHLDAVAGAVFLVAMHAVVHTGGSVPSILLGIGSGPDAATVVDGYPMARRGEAGRAIGASLAASALGGIVGAALLATSLPLVSWLMFSFGPPEIFLLALVGITFMTAVSGANLLKGMIVGSLGLMLSFIGRDPELGIPRFTFGQTFLWDGLGVIPAIAAMFAVPETIAIGASRAPIAARAATDAVIRSGEMLTGAMDVIRHRWLALRTSVLGALIGVVPGLGGEVAAWVCYGHAVQTARDPARFGQGAVEGVIAPDAANNSKEGGALLPTLFLGIPGSSGMSILLGALVALGVQPGPQVVLGHVNLAWTLVWTLVIANVLGAVMLAAVARWLTTVTRVPGGRLAPFVLVFTLLGCLVGTAGASSLFVLAVLSMLGVWLARAGWPRAPFAIGIVLGNVAERALHQSLSLWGARFLFRPGAIILLVLVLGSVAYHARGRLSKQ
ncbi:MAG: tripartite tricarboxylate transporter permease [Acidobacteria bacterium]|nr:tripartite tricarboxylate transporter permease [Acidobacteriota bacterium]